MVKKCNCDRGRGARYQDERYGIGMGVHNAVPSKTHSEKPDYVCTVCGARKTGD